MSASVVWPRGIAGAGLGLLAAALSGCTLVVSIDEECVTDSDCEVLDEGLVCVQGMCVRPASAPEIPWFEPADWTPGSEGPDVGGTEPDAAAEPDAEPDAAPDADADAAPDAEPDSEPDAEPETDAGPAPPGSLTCAAGFGDTLPPDGSLAAGKAVCSTDGAYRFGLTPEGELVLRSDAGWLWSAGICCGATVLRMQGDGNLVVRDAEGTALWSSKTEGNDGAELWVWNDGYASIQVGANYLWWTDQVHFLTPQADTWVHSGMPGYNYGDDPALLVDGAPDVYETLIRFAVPELGFELEKVTLWLYVTDASPDGPRLYLTGPDWGEGSVTWANKPATQGEPVVDLGPVSLGWLAMDLTDAFTGPGAFSVILVPDDQDGVDFESREGYHRPELIITGAH